MSCLFKKAPNRKLWKLSEHLPRFGAKYNARFATDSAFCFCASSSCDLVESQWETAPRWMTAGGLRTLGSTEVDWPSLCSCLPLAAAAARFKSLTGAVAHHCRTSAIHS